MEVTTPCLVCAVQARLGKPSYADRGLDWPLTEAAGSRVHKACASEVEYLAANAADIAVDAAGVARWKSSGNVLPDETAKLAAVLGFARGYRREATRAAAAAQAAAAIAGYTAYRAEYGYSSEELAEAGRELGPDAVDVITGQRLAAITAAAATDFRPVLEPATVPPLTCRKCRYPITPVPGSPGEYTAVSTDTANGLSYCPPNPDAARPGLHVPKRERTR